MVKAGAPKKARNIEGARELGIICISIRSTYVTTKSFVRLCK